MPCFSGTASLSQVKRAPGERSVILLFTFPEPLPMDRARGIQVVHSIAALGKAGINVDFSFVPTGTDPFTYYGVVQPANVRVIPISRSLPWPLQRIHSNRLYAARLNGFIDLATVPVMLRHLKLAAWLAVHPARPHFIYEAHEVFADTAPKKHVDTRRAEEARVIARAAAVITNSEATANRLTELYGKPERLEVIPNGVMRPDEVDEKDWKNARHHIIYSGSLFPWKGVADLVSAGAGLTGYEIDIVGGDGQRIKELRAVVSKNGARINFLGHLAHEEVMIKLQTACIAVIPNRAETDSRFTSPIKLFEYMAAGCAIVASDLPALREVIGQDDVVWTRPGDPKSIKDAITSLAEDPVLARELGRRVREKSKRFTWDSRAERIRDILVAMNLSE